MIVLYNQDYIKYNFLIELITMISKKVLKVIELYNKSCNPKVKVNLDLAWSKLF